MISQDRLAGEPGDEFSADQLIRVVKKLDAATDQTIAAIRSLPDGKIACRFGCDHCCHRVVGALIPEVVRIADEVHRRFSEVERDSLRERCQRYVEACEPYHDGRISQARPTCPFLDKGGCSIYAERPLTCRGWNSRSVDACIARNEAPAEVRGLPSEPRIGAAARNAVLNLSLDLHRSGLSHDVVDLGPAILASLTDPDLADRYLKGERVLTEFAMTGEGPDPAIEQSKKTAGIPRPSGFPLKGSSADKLAKRLSALTMPPGYGSDEQVHEAMDTYISQVQELADSRWDPGEMFDALSRFQTFNVPYCGEDVTEILRTVGEQFVAKVVSRALPDLVAPIDRPRRSGKIRIGYLSKNLRYHNSGRWVLPWIQNHSDEFESFAFNVGPWRDHVSLEFRRAADHYYQLPSDIPSTASFIRSLDLDVLVFTDIGDFGPHFQYGAMRLARVQCTGWGQPVTSGLPTIDWFLSPDLMEIEGSESQYTERLIRLPGTGLIWPKPEPLVGERPRSTYGLPDGLLYFVAQNPMKLTPKWDFLYKRIQERTGATIVFADHNVAGATAIAKHRIEMAGIQAHWLTPMPPQDFLRVQQLCDVSLDAPAWSGGNTTLDSLAVGRPVVTLCGDSLRSNHASAFLTLCGLEGLVAHSPEEYVEIATDLDRLRAAMAGFKSEALFERTDGLLELERVIRQTVST